MNIEKLLLSIIEEQNVLRTSKSKPLIDAIKNRKKITFYYSGPTKPKKDSVKSGYRVKAEAVALGLSKKGNLVVRAYVQPPSTTKTGFEKHGWRTFMVSRMKSTQITDEIFNEKRPGYKEGDDNGLSVTYATADWTTKSDVKKPRIVKPTPSKSAIEPDVDSTKATVEPQTQELPQPNPEEKPTNEPIQTPQDNDNQEYIDKQKELYKAKQTDWINKQKEIGGNIKPGQGTRERFKKEVEKELPQPKPEEKPAENPEDEEDNNLQESLKRIKRLMFS